MICKNKNCKNEVDQRWTWQVFCCHYCYSAYWNQHAKEKKQHKLDDLSSDIETLNKKLSKANSKSKL